MELNPTGVLRHVGRLMREVDTWNAISFAASKCIAWALADWIE